MKPHKMNIVKQQQNQEIEQMPLPLLCPLLMTYSPSSPKALIILNL